MRMETTLLLESQRIERLTNLLRKRRQCRSIYPCPKNSRSACVGKEANPGNRDRKCIGANLSQSRSNQLRIRNLAEKLQRDVISAATHKSHARQAWKQGTHIIIQPLLNAFVHV